MGSNDEFRHDEQDADAREDIQSGQERARAEKNHDTKKSERRKKPEHCSSDATMRVFGACHNSSNDHDNIPEKADAKRFWVKVRGAVKKNEVKKNAQNSGNAKRQQSFPECRRL